jgi:hypothetical protein
VLRDVKISVGIGKKSKVPGKYMAIEKWEAPRNVTELRGFLGFTNYYAIYLPAYANLAARLQPENCKCQGVWERKGAGILSRGKKKTKNF